MATPTEIAALIEQAWNLDPEEYFFEFLYDVFQSNETLFSLGENTHEQVKAALEAYIAAGGNSGDESQDEPTGDETNPQGDTPS